MAQPNLWGGVLDSLQSPLTLGGLSLLAGEGLQPGIAAGTALTKQAQAQRSQEAVRQGLLGMPNLNDSDRQVLGNSPELANEVLGNIYKQRFDPMAGVDLAYKKALTEKAQREAADAGSAFGKTGTIVQGSDGRFYSVQFGSRGQRQILPLELGGGAPAAAGGVPAPAAVLPAAPGGAPQPTQSPVSLTPSRGVDVVGDQMFDKATGAPVRSVGSNLAEGERQKVIGKETGQGQMGLPKATLALKEAEEQDKTVSESIDKAVSQSDGWTTGFMGSITSYVPGTAAHNLGKTLETVKSNLGFDKLQNMRNNSPTGGALGQVSEMENRLLQSVWGSVEQSQSKEQLVENLNKIKEVRARFTEMRRQAYDQDVARFGSANVPDPVTGKLPGASGAAPAPTSGGFKYLGRAP